MQPNLATLSFTVTNGTFTWNGQGSGNSASDGENWTHGVAPIYGDLVVFNSTSSKTADIVTSYEFDNAADWRGRRTRTEMIPADKK